jgi:hypothetical protein
MILDVHVQELGCSVDIPNAKKNRSTTSVGVKLLPGRLGGCSAVVSVAGSAMA